METKLITEKMLKQLALLLHCCGNGHFLWTFTNAWIYYSTAANITKAVPGSGGFKTGYKTSPVFYNTEAVYGAPINGIVIAMEEQRHVAQILMTTP